MDKVPHDDVSTYQIRTKTLSPAQKCKHETNTDTVRIKYAKGRRMYEQRIQVRKKYAGSRHKESKYVKSTKKVRSMYKQRIQVRKKYAESTLKPSIVLGPPN